MIENAAEDMTREVARLLVYEMPNKPLVGMPLASIEARVAQWTFEEKRDAAHWIQRCAMNAHTMEAFHVPAHVTKLVASMTGEPQPPAIEKVNHPSHYGGADNPYEVIKVLRAWLTPEEYRGFLKGNIIKYLARSTKKGVRVEDQQKAAWYARALEEAEKPIG